MTKHNEESRRLEDRLSRLPGEIAPARDLWPEIEARIRAGEDRPRAPAHRYSWRHVAVAASVALVGIFVATLSYRDGDRPPAEEIVAHTVPQASTFGPGHVLGSDYQAARAGLADDLEQRLQALPPETRQTVLDNLATIRRAADEINAALGKDPANVLLQHQLLAAYQDELTVLANLQRAMERLPPRNEI